MIDRLRPSFGGIVPLTGTLKTSVKEIGKL